MKLNLKPNPTLKQMIALSAFLPLVLFSSCATPAAPTNPTGDGNSSDGNVTIEGKVYSEAQIRSSVQCFKSSANSAARMMGSQFETTLNAAVTLKGQGQNVQYEQGLSGLVQAMLVMDRSNADVSCIN